MSNSGQPGVRNSKIVARSRKTLTSLGKDLIGYFVKYSRCKYTTCFFVKFSCCYYTVLLRKQSIFSFSAEIVLLMYFVRLQNTNGSPDAAVCTRSRILRENELELFCYSFQFAHWLAEMDITIYDT